MSTTTVIDFPITTLNQAYLIQLPATLTAIEAASFKQMFNRLCNTSSTSTRIVLDFSRTEFIESRGIGVLVDIVEVAKQKEIDLTFWSVAPQIQMQLSSVTLKLLSVIDRDTQSIFIKSQDSQKKVHEFNPIIKSIATRFNFERIRTYALSK